MKLNLREPRVQKTILACLVIAGAGAYYFIDQSMSFSYRPREKVVAEKREERDKLAADVQRARASATRLAELRKESDELEARWKAVQARLPDQVDAKVLMSEITAIGTSEGLQFLLLEPKPPRPLDFCQEVPFSVRVLGYYHQLGHFMAALDNAPRILRLANLRVVQNPKSKDDKTQPSIIAEFDVSTFVLGGALPGGAAPMTPAGEGGTAAVGASTKGAAAKSAAAKAKPSAGQPAAQGGAS